MTPGRRISTALLCAYAVLVTALLFFQDRGERTTGHESDAGKLAPEGGQPLQTQLAASASEGVREAVDPPQSPTADDENSILTAIVVNEEHDPVEGALVYLRRHGVARPMGTTDARGELRLQRAGPGDGSLHATHPEFAPGETAFLEGMLRRKSAMDPPRLVVVMRPQAKLWGIAMVYGQPAPKGVQVRAAPSLSAIRTSYQPPRDFLADPDHLSASTDERGEFCLLVDPDRSYALCLGGQGLVQRSELRAVRARDSRVVVEMSYGYILPLEFVDENGSAVQCAGNEFKKAGSLLIYA
jgi:hypothetical protein